MSESADLVLSFEDPPADIVVEFENQNPDIIVSFQDTSNELVINFDNNLSEVTVDFEPPLPDVVVEFAESLPPLELVFSEIGLAGPQGPPGEVSIFTYTMPVAQTTATFNHPLGHDPVAIQVLVDGQVADEYSVTFPLPSQSVQIGFDISVAAVIRLL